MSDSPGRVESNEKRRVFSRIPISGVRRSFVQIFPILLVFIYMCVIAFITQPACSAPIDGVILALAYLFFAGASIWTLAWLIHIHRLAGAIGALVLSPLFVWHFRSRQAFDSN